MTVRSLGLLLVALAALPALPASARAQGDLRTVRVRAAPAPHHGPPPDRPYGPWVGGWGWGWGLWGSGLSTFAAAAAGAPPAPPRRIPPTRVIAVGADDAPPAGRVLAERVEGGRVRVRWAAEAVLIGEVSLVLADAARAVFATVRPLNGAWTAEFADDPRAAFAGLLLVRPDGTSTTTLVPLPPR
jgi:hypothetical protein